jgi:thioredoxin-dependent peroxiredoxin
MKALKEGDHAPAFLELTANRGSTVVVYFYPKDFTPGCTTEACAFRDLYPRITEKNAVVLGVSPDSPESHEKFIAKHGLPYALVADEDHRVAQAYGVWKEKSLYGRKFMGMSQPLEPPSKRMGIERTTFIIDSVGKIKKIFHSVSPKGHAAEILAAL